MRQEDKLKYDFMPAAIEIIERPLSPVGPLIIWLLFSLIISALIWSVFGKMDQFVIARGVIVPEGKVANIQPLESGKVTEILVEEGQKVKAGQLLVKVDPNLKEIDIQSSQKQLNKLIGEKLAIESISKNESLTIPEDLNLSESEVSNLKKYIESEIESFNLQQDALDEQKSSLNNQIAKTNDEQAEGSNKIKDLSTQLNENTNNIERVEKEIATTEKEMLALQQTLPDGPLDLNNKEHIETANVLKELSNQVLVLKENYTSYISNVERIKGEIQYAEGLKSQNDKNQELLDSNLDEVNSQKEVLSVQRESQLIQLLLEKESQIEALKIEVEKAEKTKQVSEIRATTSGVINNLSDFNNGGFISPGQNLMQIVPTDATYFVKADVLNKDIGLIKEGQTVEVKVDTFSPRIYGTITGEVTNISTNSVQNEQLGMVFRTETSLENNRLAIDKKGMKLQSGMEVTVEINIDKKPIIEVILEPVFTHFKDGIQL